MREFYWYNWARLGCLILAFGMMQALAGCPPPPPPMEPETATCVDVCTHWEGLGCEEARPTPAGEPCTSVCKSMVSTGIFEWNLDCMAEVKACEDIESCSK
jgi:hypothetical protein